MGIKSPLASQSQDYFYKEQDQTHINKRRICVSDVNQKAISGRIKYSCVGLEVNQEPPAAATAERESPSGTQVPSMFPQQHPSASAYSSIVWA